MGVVVEPSAREMFTPRELADAYEDFIESGPKYVDDQTGIKASAYRYGERELLVYEVAEMGLVVLTHPTSSKRPPRSPNSTIPDNTDHAVHGDRLHPSLTQLRP